jgi:hypothetical protein
MYNLSLIFILLSIIIYLIGFIPYVYHVFHGRVVPHPFSWTVGAILVSVNTFQLLSTDGVSLSLASPLLRVTALSIGAIIGWIYIRRISIGILDYIALASAGIVIGIASTYGVSQAVIPTIVIDMFVLYPTLHKIWLDPHSEDMLVWVTTALSLLCLLFSFEHHSFANSLFWTYSMSVNIIVALFIIYRTRYMDRLTERVKSFFRSVFAFSHKI